MHHAFEAKCWMSNFPDCTLGIIKIIFELNCLDTIRIYLSVQMKKQCRSNIGNEFAKIFLCVAYHSLLFMLCEISLARVM